MLQVLKRCRQLLCHSAPAAGAEVDDTRPAAVEQQVPQVGVTVDEERWGRVELAQRVSQLHGCPADRVVGGRGQMEGAGPFTRGPAPRVRQVGLRLGGQPPGGLQAVGPRMQLGQHTADLPCMGGPQAACEAAARQPLQHHGKSPRLARRPRGPLNHLPVAVGHWRRHVHPGLRQVLKPGHFRLDPRGVLAGRLVHPQGQVSGQPGRLDAEHLHFEVRDAPHPRLADPVAGQQGVQRSMRDRRDGSHGAPSVAQRGVERHITWARCTSVRRPWGAACGDRLGGVLRHPPIPSPC